MAVEEKMNIRTQKSAMVKLNPKLTSRLKHLAEKKGTNVNALTNKVMAAYIRFEKRKEAENSL